MEQILTHGGDWASYVQHYGKRPLDFSANISPLGVPKGVQQALSEAAAEVDCYPDPLCRALRAAISAQIGVPADHIICGNGAADLVFRIVWALRPQQALITAPTFSEYQAALCEIGCTVEQYFLLRQNGFCVQQDILEAITGKTDMVFLCEPNNPTGVITPRPLLEQILQRTREVGAWLVLDECFGDFLQDSDRHSCKASLEEFPNLIILKAMTKLYAMAGVRLGYALCANERCLTQIQKTGQPWSVSGLAQAAGIAAMQESEYAEQVRALVARARPRLAEGLRRLGLEVIEGQANYLLFQSQRPLAAALQELGILLRECGNYSGLDATWYRVAVRTEAQNDMLLAALQEVLK